MPSLRAIMRDAKFGSHCCTPQRAFTMSRVPHPLAAIDFGITNIDAVARVDGELRSWTRPSVGAPTESIVREVLAEGGVALDSLPALAVTGGQHRSLPAVIRDTRVVAVAEVNAIGRGGQALVHGDTAPAGSTLLVVSAGSGTAVVSARADRYAHVTGTGVGGGTLLGLARLLFNTTDVAVIDSMALRGDPNGADLALRDVVHGPIGTLPPDATAVNFGRLARDTTFASPDDLAAALMTLVGQVIAITAINAARAESIASIVLIGHMADSGAFRRVIDQVGAYYGTEIAVPRLAGFGTALGAMEFAAGEQI